MSLQRSYRSSIFSCVWVRGCKSSPFLKITHHHRVLLRSQVQSDHDFIIQETKVLNDYQFEVERFLNLTISDLRNVTRQFSNAQEQLEDELAVEEEGTVQVATTLHALTSTVLYVKVLTDCRNKLIPLSILSPSLLRADLKTLQTNLHTRNRTLSIPIDRLSTYYHLPISSCLVSPTKVTVTIRIPIRDSHASYHLLKVQALPFAF